MRHRQLSLLSPIPVPQFHSSLMLYMRVSALLVTAERTPRSSIRFVATLSSLITSVCVVQFGDISRVRYIQQMTKILYRIEMVDTYISFTNWATVHYGRKDSGVCIDEDYFEELKEILQLQAI